MTLQQMNCFVYCITTYIIPSFACFAKNKKLLIYFDFYFLFSAHRKRSNRVKVKWLDEIKKNTYIIKWYKHENSFRFFFLLSSNTNTEIWKEKHTRANSRSRQTNVKREKKITSTHTYTDIWIAAAAAAQQRISEHIQHYYIRTYVLANV